MKFQPEASISFDSIFGNSSESISLEKIDMFLEHAVQECFKKSNIDPQELIRITDKGKVFWMTAEQAEQYASNMDAEHRKTVEKKIHDSLRGDSQFLSQEIRILLSMSFGTIQRYQKQQLIPLQEVQRVELVLNRLGRAVISTLDSLRQVELNMKSTRRKNPVVDEFEAKMGQFLTLQKQGNNDQAALLAKDLVGLKKRYLVVSKMLNNDKNQSQSFRLDAQRHKKSILSNQKYLAAQREGVLQEELQDQRKSLQNVKAVLEKDLGDERGKYEKMLKAEEEKHTRTENELNVVQREQAILEKKEKETEDVIQKMETELSDVTPQEQPKQEPRKEEKKEPPKEPAAAEEDMLDEDPKKNVRRMARTRK